MIIHIAGTSGSGKTYIGNLFKQKIKIQHIIYILILTLWTRPILQQSLERQELAPFLDKILDYIMMLFIVFV